MVAVDVDVWVFGMSPDGLSVYDVRWSWWWKCCCAGKSDFGPARTRPVEEVLRRMSHSRSDAPPFVAVKLPHCLSRLVVQVFPEGVS